MIRLPDELCHQVNAVWDDAPCWDDCKYLPGCFQPSANIQLLSNTSRRHTLPSEAVDKDVNSWMDELNSHLPVNSMSAFPADMTVIKG